MKKLFTLSAMLFLLSALVLTGCGLPVATSQLPTAVQSSVAAIQSQAASTPVASVSPVAGTLTDLETTLERIYTQVNPSVVNIQVVQEEQATSPAIPNLPFFRSPTPPQEPQYREGAGSGFVWDKDGHIVTNNHVVDNADTISVTFYDGTTVSGKVVGTDPDSDLAVVKVDVPAEQLQPVQMADSTQVKVGQLTVAIGNPFALEGTMTVGFVSALGRLLPVESTDAQTPGYSIPDVIQTDAPINPGNSGGVLVDDQGQVIGVTSAIISPVRASAGIGFAIPSAIVQKVVPVLIKSGHYEHSWLGVSGTSLNPDLAKAMDLKSDQRGALVVEVVSGGPADKAGLHGSDRQVSINGQQARVGGDVIVAIDSQPVKAFDDVVTYLVRNTEVGQTVNLTVLRQNKEETFKVTLTARPQSSTQQAQPRSTRARGGTRLGIMGQTVTPEIAQAMGLSADQQGVLVEQVETGSPADQAGLRGGSKSATINGRSVSVGGDIIVAFDGQPVKQMEDLQTLIRQAQPDQKMTLTVLRDGKQLDLSVTLTRQPASTP
jgi:serine protease Do